MIVIKLQGGLGNQMFQYAIAIILAFKNSETLLIENRFFENQKKSPGFTPRKFELNIFNNNYVKASKKDLSTFRSLSLFYKFKKKIGLNYPKVYNELDFGFQQDVLTLKAPVFLKGYFQSYKYFEGNEKLIKNVFSFRDLELDSKNKKIFNKLNKENSISIHIRRGDYVNDKITENYHGSCTLDYYLEAIKFIKAKYKNVTLVFFSDDCDWVKVQFKDLPYLKIFIDHNKDENSWKDMLLMSICKHNIIANSTFSWWAAWLNNNPRKTIIAPKKWYTNTELSISDLIPSQWIRI
nr:alpha-1,2-fucosyltransferase [Flaviramulus sp.]